MDSAYTFGEIEVVCEGYDYPDDPYILAGSCGVRNSNCRFFIENEPIFVY